MALHNQHGASMPAMLTDTARTAGVQLIETLDTLLFPRACGCCGSASDDIDLCCRCAEALNNSTRPICLRCGADVPPGLPLVAPNGKPTTCGACMRLRFGFDSVLPLGPYDGPLRELCLRMKRRGGAYLAGPLAARWIDARGSTLREYLTAGTAPGASVVSVPLYWRRRLTRGYNQADALASEFAKRLKLTHLRAVLRVQDTQKLAGLSRAERLSSLKDAFRATRHATRHLASRDIILVDDILTTGATCSLVARALKHAGAARVVAVVLARATRDA